MPAMSRLNRLTGWLKPHDQGLAVTAGHRNVVTTSTETWAVYKASPALWANTDQGWRDQTLEAQASVWARLGGGTVVWLYGDTEPFPTHDYHRALLDKHPHPLPDTDGATTWADKARAAAIETQAISQRGAATPFLIVAVRVANRATTGDNLARIFDTDPLPARMGAVEATRVRLHEVTEILAGPGFNAVPLTEPQTRWVMGLASAPGGPAPVTDSDDVTVTTAAESTVSKVVALRDGETHTRYTTVLRVANIEDRETTDRHLPPWMGWSLNRATPRPFTARFEVYSGDQVQDLADMHLRRNENIKAHWHEFNLTPPAAVQRGIDRAAHIADETATGNSHDATRLIGSMLIAVTETTERATIDAAKAVRTAAQTETRMRLDVSARGQWEDLRSFVLGEAWPAQGRHVLQLNARMAAAGVPNLRPATGANVGYPVGPIVGTPSIRVENLHEGSETNRGGVIIFAGSSGAGKSSSAAAMTDFSVHGGVQAFITDPVGDLARVADQKHLRGRVWHLPLLDAPAGTFDPYTLILDPDPHVYDTSRDKIMETNPGVTVADADARAAAELAQYERDVDTAATTRRERAVDTIMRHLLPVKMVTNDRDGTVEQVVLAAVGSLPGDYGTDPWLIVDALRRMNTGVVGDTAQRVADLIEAQANFKIGRLFLPPRGGARDLTALHNRMRDADMILATAPGIALPPDMSVDRAQWTTEQVNHQGLLEGAAWLALRFMTGSRERKISLQDELGVTGAISPAQVQLARRNGMDVRRYNSASMWLAQTMSAFNKVDPEFHTLVGAFYGFRMSRENALAALPYWGVGEEVGLQHAAPHLPDGRCFVRSWSDRAPTLVQFDQGWFTDELASALNTSPASAPVPAVQGAVGAW